MDWLGKSARSGVWTRRPNCASLKGVAWLLTAWLAVGAGFAGTVSADEPLRPLHELIDEQIAAGWQARGVTPAGPASDAEFLRRVSLDLTGTLPTSAAARTFLSDAAPDKRTRLIDALLASPEYVRHMQHLFDVMLIERQYANYVTDLEWQEYLRASFAENKPWDQMAKELLGVDGVDPKVRPALRFFFARTVDSYRVMNPNALTRDIGRLFLGINLQCAQCHNHPVIKDYKQADYFGIYAFVSRSHIATIKQEGKDVYILNEKPDGDVKFTSVFDKTKTEYKTTPRLPEGTEIAEPALEKGKEYAVAPADGVRPIPAYSRREQLVKLLPSVESAAFKRNMANRLWDLMFGRGIVHPVEVHHSENPPSHPELLTLVADRFAAGKFDIKAYLRELALSKTYQLASTGPANPNQVPPESFAVAPLKPLKAEPLMFAMMRATGFTEAIQATLPPNSTEADLYKALAGSRTPFVAQYGHMPGQAETTFEASLEQALFVSNNSLVPNWIQPRPGSLVDRLLKLTEPAAIAEELYLSVYTRLPEADEVAAVTEYLKTDTEDRKLILQELVWSMITSVEFRFNH